VDLEALGWSIYLPVRGAIPTALCKSVRREERADHGRGEGG
jgi:hypothetical protein